jgi:hypothetical protein
MPIIYGLSRMRTLVLPAGKKLFTKNTQESNDNEDDAFAYCYTSDVDSEKTMLFGRIEERIGCALHLVL